MLEGTLDDFSLADIFQLLALTAKTGCLRVRHDGAQGRVHFDQGLVRHATTQPEPTALARRLIGAGLVATAQLRDAVDRQQAQEVAGGATRLVAEAAGLDGETLETHVREQIQDAVFDLMRWEGGTFRFDHGAAPGELDEAVRVPLEVEELISESLRRLEEWERLVGRIPGPDAIVIMATSPEDDAGEVRLRGDEWRLLSLVDGRRNVAELVELLGQGQFATCRLLDRMVGAGLLEIVGVGTQDGAPVARLLEQHALLRLLADAGPAAPVAVHATAPAAADPTPVPDPDAPDPTTPDTAGRNPAMEAGTPAPRAIGDDVEWDLPQPEGEVLTDEADIDADLVRRLLDGVRGL